MKSRLFNSFHFLNRHVIVEISLWIFHTLFRAFKYRIKTHADSRNAVQNSEQFSRISAQMIVSRQSNLPAVRRTNYLKLIHASSGMQTFCLCIYFTENHSKISKKKKSTELVKLRSGLTFKNSWNLKIPPFPRQHRYSIIRYKYSTIRHFVQSFHPHIAPRKNRKGSKEARTRDEGENISRTKQSRWTQLSTVEITVRNLIVEG